MPEEQKPDYWGPKVSACHGCKHAVLAPGYIKAKGKGCLYMGEPYVCTRSSTSRRPKIVGLLSAVASETLEFLAKAELGDKSVLDRNGLCSNLMRNVYELEKELQKSGEVLLTGYTKPDFRSVIHACYETKKEKVHHET